METNNNQVSQPAVQSGAVDYAAALRQYNKYGRGRSMKKFCEDEGYDYWKFCKLAREGQAEMVSKSGTSGHPGFIEVNPDGTHSPATPEEPMQVCEILKGIGGKTADRTLICLRSAWQAYLENRRI